MKIKTNFVFKIFNLMAILGLFVVCSFAVGLSQAQAAGGVAGTVKLPNGSSTPAGVTVILSSDEVSTRESGAIATVTTAVDGTFSFSNVQNGQSYVHALADASTDYANSEGTSVDVNEGVTSNV